MSARFTRLLPCLVAVLLWCGCTPKAPTVALSIHGVSAGMSRQDVLAGKGAPRHEDGGTMEYDNGFKVFVDQSGMVIRVGPGDQLEVSGALIAKAGDPVERIRIRLGEPSRTESLAGARDRLYYKEGGLTVDVIHLVDSRGQPTDQTQLGGFTLEVPH